MFNPVPGFKISCIHFVRMHDRRVRSARAILTKYFYEFLSALSEFTLGKQMHFLWATPDGLLATNYTLTQCGAFFFFHM